MQKKEIALLIVLCFLSRLPQLLSQHLILDGDESIVGLMAKHLYEGKGLPVYFYGQSYGFSIIEVLVIDLFYLFFGITDIAVKLAMLSLWTLGLLLFYLSLKQFSKKQSYLPFFISLLLIFAPVWTVWSMKARGGYISAFVIFNFISYLLFLQQKNRSFLFYVLIGFCLVLLAECQALFLPGLLPILIYRLIPASRLKAGLGILSGLIPTAFVVYLLKKGQSTYWAPQVFKFDQDWMANLVKIPEQIYTNMCGTDYYWELLPLTGLNTAIAIGFTVLILGTPLMALFRMILKKGDSLYSIFSLSILATLFYLIFLDGFSARYLLPLFGFFLFALFVFFDHLSLKPWLGLVFSIPMLVLTYNSFSFKDYTFGTQTRSSLMAVCKELEAKKIEGVFCNDGLLQWQLMFYSKEKLIARFVYPSDRYQPYVQKVNQTFQTKKEAVVMLGFNNFMPLNANDPRIIVAKNYLVYFQPNEEVLKQYGFQF